MRLQIGACVMDIHILNAMPDNWGDFISQLAVDSMTDENGFTGIEIPVVHITDDPTLTVFYEPEEDDDATQTGS